jgi:hypothetical protein
MATPSICSIPDCGKPVHNVRGWCLAHYQRWRRHGDPLGGGRSHAPKGELPRFYREVVLQYEGDECLIWPYTRTKKGYAKLGRYDYVCRMVCEERHGPPPTQKHQAAHSCGRGEDGCVTKRHLDWKTPSANQMDRVTHGTSNRGERCGSAKLTAPQVREIRELVGKIPHREIGAMYGIEAATVYSIMSGKSWGWLA